MLRNIEITRLLRYNRANMKELFEAEVWLRQMARLRNFVRKNSPRGFRAVLFRMVPKLGHVVKLKATVDVLETFLSAIKHDDGEFYHGSERRSHRASGSLSERVGKST